MNKFCWLLHLTADHAAALSDLLTIKKWTLDDLVSFGLDDAPPPPPSTDIKMGPTAHL